MEAKARFKPVEQLGDWVCQCEGLKAWHLKHIDKVFIVDPTKVKMIPAGTFVCPSCRMLYPEIRAIWCISESRWVWTETIDIDEGSLQCQP